MTDHFRPRRGVGTQALLLTGASAISQLATALMFIVAARRSDPKEFGIVVAAVAAGATVAGLVDFGTNAYWVRQIARGEETGLSLSVRATGKLLSGLLSASLLGAAILVVAPATKFWIAGLVGCGILLSQTSRVPLTGTGRADLAAIPAVIERILGACILLGLTGFGLDAPSALWVALVAGAVSASVITHALTPKANRFRLRFRFCPAPWAGASNFGLSSVAVSAQTLDVTLLSAVGSPSAAALYGAVSRWTQPMALMANAFASSAAPFIAHSGEFAQAWARTRRALWFPVTAVFVSGLVAVAAPLVVHVLLGDQYQGSASVLRLLAIATIPAIVNQVCAVSLQSLGHDRAVAGIVSGAVLVQLVLVCALASALGALGAAVALLIMQCTLMLALLACIAVVRRATPRPIESVAALQGVTARASQSSAERTHR